MPSQIRISDAFLIQNMVICMDGSLVVWSSVMPLCQAMYLVHSNKRIKPNCVRNDLSINTHEFSCKTENQLLANTHIAFEHDKADIKQSIGNNETHTGSQS